VHDAEIRRGDRTTSVSNPPLSRTSASRHSMLSTAAKLADERKASRRTIASSLDNASEEAEAPANP
jgi:hypothetical protein